MVNVIRCWFVRLLVLGAALAAAGCTHMPGTAGAGGAFDRERLSSAIALDDVSQLRALVDARAIASTT